MAPGAWVPGSPGGGQAADQVGPTAPRGEHGGVRSQTEFRVRWEECDLQGIVFFGEYSTYLAAALADLWRGVCGSYHGLVEAIDTELVTAELRQRFRQPARYDELVVMDVHVFALRRASLHTSFRLHRAETLLVEGEVRHACVDRRTFAKVSHDPPGLRDLLNVPPAHD